MGGGAPTGGVYSTDAVLGGKELARREASLMDQMGLGMAAVDTGAPGERMRLAMEVLRVLGAVEGLTECGAFAMDLWNQACAAVSDRLAELGGVK